MSQFLPSDRQLPAPQDLRMGVHQEAHHPREYTADYGGQGYEEGNDLREILTLLRRNLGMIVLVTALVTGSVAYFVLKQPPEYSASAIIRLKDVRGAITAGTGDAGLEALMLGRQTDPLLSELEVL